MQATTRVHSLWDALASYGAGQVDEALRYALREVASLLQAQQAFWIGSVRIADCKRDPAKGWRARVVQFMDPNAIALARTKSMNARIERGQVSPGLAANLAQAGTFRINVQHEMVPGWQQTPDYEGYYAELGVQDMLFAASPVGADFESWFGFYRITPEPSLFSEQDKELLAYTMRPLLWFHKRLALHFGLIVAEQPLTPLERKVLSGLLTEKTERELADQLELTPSSLHTYCVRICRKFGVRGRSGLTALWLGQVPVDAGLVGQAE